MKIKSRNYTDFLKGVLRLADDTGIEVESLRLILADSLIIETKRDLEELKEIDFNKNNYDRFIDSKKHEKKILNNIDCDMYYDKNKNECLRKDCNDFGECNAILRIQQSMKEHNLEIPKLKDDKFRSNECYDKDL